MAICGNCFNKIPDIGSCPICGYDNTRNASKFPTALPIGTVLNQRFFVGRVLGQGGFGVTYLAQDYVTKERIAIKEYFPVEFSTRAQGSRQVQVISSQHVKDFSEGKRMFLEEASTLAELNGDSHIVRVHRYFEENATAYFSMEFIEGQGMNDYLLERRKPLTVDEANDIFLPLMESLSAVHARGIIHRDISPDNILIQPDGSAKLIDFGAARYSTGEMSKSLDMVLKHGFAPPEQYTRRSRQGPFSDVYALAANYYYAITGKIPPDAVERMVEDTFVPPSRLNSSIRKKLDPVLLKALAPNYKDRYQNMTEFREALLSACGGNKAGSATGKNAVRIVGAALLLFVLVFGGSKLKEFLDQRREGEDSGVSATMDISPESTQETDAPEEMPAVPQNVPKPSAADLDAIHADIVYPKDDGSYLEAYETMYVRAQKGKDAVFSFLDPNANKEVMRAGNYFVVYNDTEAKVLARSNGYSCVIFPALDRAGWINSEYLQSIEDLAEELTAEEEIRKPGAEDLDEIGSGIKYPEEQDYLDEYIRAIVVAPHGHSVLGFGTSSHDGTSYTVLDGEEVLIIAEHKGFSCAIIQSTQKARWVNSEYLQPID